MVDGRPARLPVSLLLKADMTGSLVTGDLEARHTSSSLRGEWEALCSAFLFGFLCKGHTGALC